MLGALSWLCLVAIFGPLLLLGGVEGATRYVRANDEGQDFSFFIPRDCSESANPCRTLRHAVGQAEPNDVVQLLASVTTTGSEENRTRVTTDDFQLEPAEANKNLTIRGQGAATRLTYSTTTTTAGVIGFKYPDKYDHAYAAVFIDNAAAFVRFENVYFGEEDQNGPGQNQIEGLGVSVRRAAQVEFVDCVFAHYKNPKPVIFPSDVAAGGPGAVALVSVGSASFENCRFEGIDAFLGAVAVTCGSNRGKTPPVSYGLNEVKYLAGDSSCSSSLEVTFKSCVFRGNRCFPIDCCGCPLGLRCQPEYSNKALCDVTVLQNSTRLVFDEVIMTGGYYNFTDTLHGADFANDRYSFGRIHIAPEASCEVDFRNSALLNSSTPLLHLYPSALGDLVVSNSTFQDSLAVVVEKTGRNWPVDDTVVIADLAGDFDSRIDISDSSVNRVTGLIEMGCNTNTFAYCSPRKSLSVDRTTFTDVARLGISGRTRKMHLSDVVFQRASAPVVIFDVTDVDFARLGFFNCSASVVTSELLLLPESSTGSLIAARLTAFSGNVSTRFSSSDITFQNTFYPPEVYRVAIDVSARNPDANNEFYFERVVPLAPSNSDVMISVDCKDSVSSSGSFASIDAYRGFIITIGLNASFHDVILDSPATGIGAFDSVASFGGVNRLQYLGLQGSAAKVASGKTSFLVASEADVLVLDQAELFVEGNSQLVFSNESKIRVVQGVLPSSVAERVAKIVARQSSQIIFSRPLLGTEVDFILEGEASAILLLEGDVQGQLFGQVTARSFSVSDNGKVSIQSSQPSGVLAGETYVLVNVLDVDLQANVPVSLNLTSGADGIVAQSVRALSIVFSELASPQNQSVSDGKDSDESALISVLLPVLIGGVVFLMLGCLGGFLVARRRRTQKAGEVEMQERHIIPFDDLADLRPIGAGNFGIVSKGTWKSRELNVAVKQLSSTDSADIAEFRREADTLIDLKPHVHVVQILGLVEEPACIVMEYMRRGSLLAYLRRFGKQKERLMLVWAKGVARGVLHLHRCDLLHGDLSARNVLLGDDLKPKVCDFGLSMRIRSAEDSDSLSAEDGEDAKSAPLAIRWAAPELFSETPKRSPGSDAWAYAVMLWEILEAGSIPFPGMSNDAVIARVMDGGAPDIPREAPIGMVTAMKGCFAQSADARPDFQAIIGLLRDSGGDASSCSSSSSGSRSEELPPDYQSAPGTVARSTPRTSERTSYRKTPADVRDDSDDWYSKTPNV